MTQLDGSDWDDSEGLEVPTRVEFLDLSGGFVSIYVRTAVVFV